MAYTDKIVDLTAAVLELAKKKTFLAYYILAIIYCGLFWFLDIYFMAPKFYRITNLWILILTSTALSITWVNLNMLAMIVEHATFRGMGFLKRNEVKNINNAFLFGAYMAVLLLSTCSGYTVLGHDNKGFRPFAEAAFKIISIFISFIVAIQATKRGIEWYQYWSDRIKRIRKVQAWKSTRSVLNS
jgi:hypothetical protein